MDLLYPDLLLGSAEIDRLMAGTWRPGDFRLVDIFTLVCPTVAWVVVPGGLLRVGEGEGLDRLGVLVDLELVDGAANLLTAGDFDLSLGVDGVVGLLLLVTFRVAELVTVICCGGRRNPNLGEQGADAD